jgi:hypothetical protein
MQMVEKLWGAVNVPATQVKNSTSSFYVNKTGASIAKKEIDTGRPYA